MLHDTGMMAIPPIDGELGAKLVEWGTTGNVVKVLFGDPEGDGPSLVWSWFGPGYPLARHSHHGADCLYYVSKGELQMGAQTVKAGEGFFLPDGAPYSYTAGPEGVEVLEFRASSSFDIRFSESDARWGQILETIRDNRDQWDAMPHEVG